MTYENREIGDKRNERHNNNYPNLSLFDKTYLHSKLPLITDVEHSYLYVINNRQKVFKFLRVPFYLILQSLLLP